MNNFHYTTATEKHSFQMHKSSLSLPYFIQNIGILKNAAEITYQGFTEKN